MQAGIIHVFPSDKNREIDWDDLFKKQLRLICFLRIIVVEKSKLQKSRIVYYKENTRMRVILPDPDDSQTMLESSRRINTTVENEIRIITDAIKDFKILVEQHPTANVEIWLLKKALYFPHFALVIELCFHLTAIEPVL